MDALSSDTTLTRFLATLTLGQLRQMKADTRNEIEGAHERVQVLEADLARIERAIADRGGRRATQPAQNGRVSNPAEGALSLRQAILKVMRERHDLNWTTQDVLDELMRRGLAPGGKKPLNTVGSRLLELTKDKKIYKTGRGVYSVAAPARMESLSFLDQGGVSE
jgi:hypothetical protein